MGHCVALVTHAQHAMRGNPSELNWKSNKWFEFIAEYTFRAGGEGGRSVGENPDDWINRLEPQVFRQAALFAEPFEGSWKTIMSVGMVGGLRIAPLTIHPGGSEVIWHERARADPVTRLWYVKRSGFALVPEDKRVHATPVEAAPQLDAALARMLEFQQEHRPEEGYFSELFSLGRRFLQCTGLVEGELPEQPKEQEVMDRVRTLFPSEFDSVSVSLVAAVDAAWALGGMGWWNDWGSADEGVTNLFRQITGEYYAAMMASLVAACEPPPV